MTERSALHDKLEALLDAELNHPWGPATPQRLARILTALVRAAQADAWLRGWGAGVLAHYKGTAGLVPTNPYRGGRHRKGHP
jgi:hypothetical protein